MRQKLIYLSRSAIEFERKKKCTLNRKNMNLPYSIRKYVLNEFLTADHSRTKKNIFEKTLFEVGSSHLYDSFGTFCVQIGQLFEAQGDFKLSEEFEIDFIFLQKQQFYRF